MNILRTALIYHHYPPPLRTSSITTVLSPGHPSSFYRRGGGHFVADARKHAFVRLDACEGGERIAGSDYPTPKATEEESGETID